MMLTNLGGGWKAECDCTHCNAEDYTTILDLKDFMVVLLGNGWKHSGSELYCSEECDKGMCAHVRSSKMGQMFKAAVNHLSNQHDSDDPMCQYHDPDYAFDEDTRCEPCRRKMYEAVDAPIPTPRLPRMK